MEEEYVDPFEEELNRAIAHQEELDRLEELDRMEQLQQEAEIESLPGAIPAPVFDLPQTASTDTIYEQEEPIKREYKSKPVKKKVPQVDVNAEFRELILKVAQEVVGPEHCAIETNKVQGTTQKEMLMLKWDYIKMFNRGNNHHEIKDMYVALPIRRTSFTESMHGFRGVISFAENVSGYYHSHLWSGSPNINPFCTGTDGINDLWADISMSNYKDKDFAIQLEGFFHQLRAFVGYESIEGTPYIRFGNISTRNIGGLSSSSVRSDVNNIRQGLNIDDIEFSIDFNSGRIEILETEHLHTIMSMYSNNHQKRLENGMYVSLNDSGPSGRGEYIEHSEFKFLGEEHKIFVEPFYNKKLNESEQEKRYAHGRVVQKFKDLAKITGEEWLKAYCLKNVVSKQNEEEGPSDYRKSFNSRNLIRVGETTKEGVVRPVVLEDEQDW